MATPLDLGRLSQLSSTAASANREGLVQRCPRAVLFIAAPKTKRNVKSFQINDISYHFVRFLSVTAIDEHISIVIPREVAESTGGHVGTAMDCSDSMRYAPSAQNDGKVWLLKQKPL